MPFTFFGLWKTDRENAAEREPLLPQYNDDTPLQRELHQKLHSYQMLRALTQGYMPSTQQAVTNLRTLLAADALNPDGVTADDLSESGRLLVMHVRDWLGRLAELLANKNGGDQVQDLLWCLSKAKVDVDVGDVARRAKKARARADAAAAYKSLQTVGELLLTNSDFRLFLSDLETIGREVFRDTAFKLSEVAEDAGKQLEPSKEDQEALKHAGGDAGPAPSGKELEEGAAEVGQVITNGAAKVLQGAEQSLVDKVQGDERETLLYRLKQAVLKLRKRRDYSDSVSVLSRLIQRYALVYSRAVQETFQAAEDDVHENEAVDRALRNFWSFLKSFGDPKEWEELEHRLKSVMDHGKNDPQFEKLMTDIGNSLQDMLTDPGFFEDAEARFNKLREESRQVGSNSSLRDDVDGLLAQTHKTLQAVIHDEDVAGLAKSSMKVAHILSPAHKYVNKDLLTDSIHVFVPILVQAIQYVPIPRLEVSTPDVDLLLENLILEPGRTINHTSFLPYKLRVETYNDLEIRKARFRTTSTTTSLMTIKLDGLSLRASDLGFWMRAHAGLLRFADEGIASFALDERGIDIHLDLELGADRLEHMLTLKAVRVHVHKLNYTLSKSRFALIAWLLKPFLRPLLRSVLARCLARAIADALHAANRELLFARERLRATRIADPNDLTTFFRAVLARLTPADDPDMYSRVGIAEPGAGVFRGVYAPGSLVKVWNEEGVKARERVEEFEEGGWRSGVFDVRTVAA